MKKLLTIMLALMLCGSAVANITYTETLDISNVQPYVEGGVGNVGWRFWYHNNPTEEPYGPYTPEQYQQAVLSGEILDATLSMVTNWSETDNTLDVRAQDKDTVWHYLGTLAEPTDGVSTSIFSLDPGWLNGVWANIMVISTNPVNGTIEFETSTLSVTVTHSPAPGAILLGGIGVGLVGWLRRRRAL